MTAVRVRLRRSTRTLTIGGLSILSMMGGDAAWGQMQGPGDPATSRTAGVAPIPLYQQHCARCHGESGTGDGPHAVFLQPRPADFTRGRFKLKTTRPGTPPSIDNVIRTISRGIPGTAMPAFRDILNEAEISAMAAYVFTLTGRNPSRRSLRVATVPDLGPDAVIQGKRLYERLRCATCHGEEGLGDGPEAPGLRNEDGSPVRVTDLTRPWTFKGGWERIDIALRILSGMEGTPMPGYYQESLRADQLYSLVDYLLSLRRVPDLRASSARDAAQEWGAGESLVGRGERLAAILACERCHTPVDEHGTPIAALRMAGGKLIELEPVRRVVSSNLTPHATGLKEMTVEDLEQMLRLGRTPAGRGLDPIAMPWPYYAALSDADVEALHAYLTSLPPIANQIAGTALRGGLEPLLFKARALTGGPTVRWVEHAGNAGVMTGSAPKPDATSERTWVKVAGVMAILLVLEILYCWRPLMLTGLRRQRRHHRTLRERVRGPVLVLSILGMAAVIALAWWPPHGFGPTQQTIDLIAPPAPEPIGVTGDVAIIAARGKHLVEVAACAFCHTRTDPLWPMNRGPALAGGPRFAWSVFGTVQAANLTPDQQTGLGRRQPGELKRVLRSGLTDGRSIHPLSMPWTQLSRLTEEELESVITYLASIPAVENRIEPAISTSDVLSYTIQFQPD